MDGSKHSPSSPIVPTAFTFCGSRREVGYFHGLNFSQQIRRELDIALTACIGEFQHDRESFIDSCERFIPWIHGNLPQLIPEIEGLAEGAGLSFNAALFLAVSDGLRPHPKNECTSFYCARESTANGCLYLGQTKDTSPREGRYFVMRWNYEDGMEMLILNYAGWLANIGINSHRVGFCGNALYAKEHVHDCMPFSLLKRAILESHSTNEAMQYVNGECWQDGCLCIADHNGDAVYVELVKGKAHCRVITGKTCGHANSILTPQIADLDCSIEHSPCSYTRQKRVDQILAEESGRITEKTLRSLLADHCNEPHSICRHEGRVSNVRTTAAFLANLSDGWMDISIGNPCSAPFHRYQIDI